MGGQAAAAKGQQRLGGLERTGLIVGSVATATSSSRRIFLERPLPFDLKSDVSVVNRLRSISSLRIIEPLASRIVVRQVF